ncbi:MAG: hypothetical protein V3U16_03430, partial [Candidatus Neomarinimicrobiota bacterium]
SFILSGCSLFLILLFGCQEQKTNSETSIEKKSVNDTAKVNIEYLDQSKGSIYGRVVYEGNVPKPQKLLVVKDVEVCGKSDHYDERLRVGKRKGIQNAVVSLTNIQNGKPLDVMGTEFVLDQKGCSYQPHVLLVPVDTSVQILNNDGILHNIHTFSKKNRPVNLAHPKFKKKLEMVFKHPEKVSVKCDVHGWMSAWIVVVNHPYYAITDSDGSFTLDDIPTGTYTVTCWQELLGEQIAQVNIEAGASVTIDFKYNNQE